MEGHDKFAVQLRSIEFIPSKAHPGFWMRSKGDHYEYIIVFADDILILSKLHTQSLLLLAHHNSNMISKVLESLNEVMMQT